MLKRTLLSTLLLSCTTVAIAAENVPAPTAPNLTRAKEIVGQLCSACHNADGNSPLAANPVLAGQGEAYLYKQLMDFSSQAGAAPVRANPTMNAMVAALSNEEKRGLAAYFSRQKPKLMDAKEKDTLLLGQKLFRSGDAERGLPACAGCHGPAGHGIPSQYPRLTGQHAEYLTTQLANFRTSTRANDPAAMMRTIALKLSDAEMRAVSDYINGLK